MASSAPTLLLQWYAGINAKYLDLVGDYAGKERFFIEGDSLLLECLSSDQLDFDPGFQLLHAVYIIEKFLKDLSQRGCVFDIVFFHEHQNNCVSPRVAHPLRFLLARNTIIQHLRKHATSINVLRFDSLDDPLFEEYLENSAAYFVLCSDGATYMKKITKTTTLRAHEDGATGATSEAALRFGLRATIYRLAQMNLDVALLNGLEFRDSKVFAFVLDRSAMSKRDSALVSQQIDALQTSRSLVSTVESPELAQTMPTPHSVKIWNSREPVANIVSAARSALESKGWSEPSVRLLITIAALQVLSSNDDFLPMVSSCLAHTLLLEITPLAARRVSAVIFKGKTERLCDEFTDAFTAICLENWESFIKVQRSELDVTLGDLFDGRLFRGVLSNSVDIRAVLLPVRKSSVFTILLSLIAGNQQQEQAGLDFSDQSTSAPSLVGSRVRTMKIHAFNHPAFDHHLAAIKVENHDELETTREVMGGHVVAPPTTRRNQPNSHLRKQDDPKQRARLLRKHQRFLADMTAYAASLTNAQGKCLTPELIIVDKVKHSDKKSIAFRGGKGNGEVSQIAQANKPAKKKGTQPTVKDKAAAQALLASRKREDAAFLAWTTVREQFDREVDPMKKFLMANAYLHEMSNRKDVSAFANENELYKLSVLLSIWTTFCRQSKQKEGAYIATLIYDSLLRLASATMESKEMLKAVQETARQCGMTIKPPKVVEIRNLSFSFPIAKDVSLNIGEEVRSFRLTHMGPYMERAMDQADDARVTFRPDGWQRQVLNEIDAGNSLLIVAPTSSGKTFISFYAMEKILRADDTGLIVYIAPTKALVNQIAAEIQARFTKRYDHAGHSVYAIRTRETQLNNPKQCQILVTVPDILQLMLLSPANKAWVPRIKTIIFDEVHCIGQAEDGLIWEQLLLMAPCQVIALSATVGNSRAFSSWLSSTQSAMQRTLNMVEHEHRFSDLRKYVFQPPNSFEFSGLPVKPLMAPLGLEDVDGLKYLHPICCLGTSQRGIPPDLSLESRDSILLWRTMKQYESDSFPVPEELSPMAFFPEDNIVKADVISWSAKLKGLLSQWMISPASPFRKVVEELSKSLGDEGGKTTRKEEHAVQEMESSDSTGILDSTLPLLCKLRASNALPAILFNFNRSMCEDIARHLLDQLAEAEEHFKENSPTWKAKLNRYEAWKAASLAKERAQAKVVEKKKTGKADRDGTVQQQEERRDDEGSSFDMFDPSAPIENFSFADTKKGDNAELAKVLSTMEWVEIDEKLIAAFRRGIGVHHSGMNRRYRQAVEVWFRRGFLTVVIATGTLSLGINMPCKTVVFSGDSVYLTALNFRQSAGRAGRRGFDLLGNVVFQNISVRRACRLLSSRLPDLNGHFPMTTSFVLRLLQMLHGTNNAPYAMRMVNSLLSQPRLYLGGESFKHQVLHHVRFSIEYLRSQGLVGSRGEPLHFARCVSHLAWVESSAFAFHALLKHGYFHSLAVDLATSEDKTLRTLMLTMSHLFGRLAMRGVDDENYQETIKRSASLVFLPPMPQDAVETLNTHNKQTLATYVAYVKSFVEQHCSEPDIALPLTKMEFRPVKHDFGAAKTDTTEHPQGAKLRSPFVALSGHDDHFTSIADLCSSVRDGVFLEKAVIPCLDTGEDLSTPLNAYLLDFYQHGNVAALITANRIPRGDIWYVLNDFSRVLATIVASLETFLSNSDEADLDLTDAGGFADDIEKELDASEEPGDKADGSDDMESITTLADSEQTLRSSANESGIPPRNPGEGQQSTNGTQKAKKRTPVADSWDDGLSSASDQAGSDDEEDDMARMKKDAREKLDEANKANSAEEAEKKLKMVYLMFRKLKESFDEKFKAMWA